MYKSYQRRKKIPTPWESIPMLKGKINLNNFQDLFMPMFIKVKTESGDMWQWRTYDSEWNQLQREGALTASEIEQYKALSKFVRNSFGKFFTPTGYFNQTAYYDESDKPIT